MQTLKYCAVIFFVFYVSISINEFVNGIDAKPRRYPEVNREHKQNRLPLKDTHK